MLFCTDAMEHAQYILHLPVSLSKKSTLWGWGGYVQHLIYIAVKSTIYQIFALWHHIMSKPCRKTCNPSCGVMAKICKYKSHTSLMKILKFCTEGSQAEMHTA